MKQQFPTKYLFHEVVPVFPVKWLTDVAVGVLPPTTPNPKHEA